MHGFRYFSEKDLHWRERLFWLVALVASLWFCGLMTRKVWVQWTEDPVKLDASIDFVNFEATPFPTVTICPEIKATKDKLNVTAALNSFSNLSKIQ